MKKKIHIIKPSKKLSNISAINSEQQILPDSIYEVDLSQTINTEEFTYEYYDIYVNGIIVYGANVTLVKKENIIEQIVHNIPKNAIFDVSGKNRFFDKSTITGYNDLDNAQMVYINSGKENKYSTAWKALLS